MTILSVEDSVINQEMLTERLLMRDYEVIQAFTGEEAVSRINNSPEISLILLDVGLPDFSGFEVARKIRKTEQHKNTPIIFLTGYTTEEYREESETISASELMPKPVDFSLLFKRINELVV